MKIKRKWLFILLLPGLIGVILFYILPFVSSLILSFMDNNKQNGFIFLDNYIELFQKSVLTTMVGNTFLFTTTALTLNLTISFCVAYFLHFTILKKMLPVVILSIPLVIPAVSVASFWNLLFHYNGYIVKLFDKIFGTGYISFTTGVISYIPIITLFLWKNIGFSTLIYLAGLKNIPNVYFEAFKLESKSNFSLLKKIILPLIFPQTFFVLIITFINAMGIFRETYTLWKDYPPKNLYMLQHYIMNNFMKLNYNQSLSAGFILSLIVVGYTIWLLKLERRYSENH